MSSPTEIPQETDPLGYSPQSFEARWRERWVEDHLYDSDIAPGDDRPKHYALTMLPYPSGNLHIGHWYAMVPPDARARYMRMRGHNVVYPIGFDGFGLPAENAAIQRNIHPKEWTYANIDHMRGQLKMMGAMFDWRREAISCDPEYYRWTQWFFLAFHAGGLAYRKEAAVDWCPSCNTTLAREQVVGDERRCERCATEVTKRKLKQWFFRTTRYADELLDFSAIDWPERVQVLQKNWIGRSEGAHVTFHVARGEGGESRAGEPFEIFTTRPDTLWGATFMVLAPEHKLVAKITSDEQRAEVEGYVLAASRQSDVQRQATDREKTGVFTGSYAINPVNGERIPIWIADYVLMSYGFGAIMAVPAHDQRDFEFARKFGIEVRPVIAGQEGEVADGAAMQEASTARGAMVNSGELTGTAPDEAFERTVSLLEAQKMGSRAVNYRLRDWLVSRQRYWGSPIPIIHCSECGAVPVPENDLPVELPDDIDWRPTGESPLKLHESWKNVAGPQCGGPAQRETDTMDTFVCSSWYHLRYLAPHFCEGPFEPAEYGYWMPVDSYTGGIEHATMHLIYTRFFHKACRDLGLVQGDEPMMQLRNQGIILGEDSEKMSKSRGNVVAPDELVERYGSDAIRAYLMFFARWEQGGPWSSTGIEGTVRWLRRVWSLFTQPPAPPAIMKGAVEAKVVRALRRKVHQTIHQVGRHFEDYAFNTIVSSLMELLNEMSKAAQAGATADPAWREATESYLLMLAPVAPHLAEELWRNQLGKEESVHLQSWPAYDSQAATEDEITLVVQVNGKVRDKIAVSAAIGKEEAEALALASAGAQRFMAGKPARKVIVVPGRLVNIVV